MIERVAQRNSSAISKSFVSVIWTNLEAGEGGEAGGEAREKHQKVVYTV